MVNDVNFLGSVCSVVLNGNIQMLFFRRTGKPFHNFISWQDLRSAELVNSWNKSLLLKVKLC